MFKSQLKRDKPKSKFKKSKTEQSHKEAVDINNLVRLYGRRGGLPPIDPTAFGEFPAISFHEAMNVVSKMQEQFDKLPAKIRAEFDNNPAQFQEYVADPENLKNLTEAGIVTPAMRKEQEAASEAAKAATEAAQTQMDHRSTEETQPPEEVRKQA